jgi:hypothetical protein
MKKELLFLFFKVYEDYIANIPAQKKFRKEKFIELYSMISKQFVSNGKLANFQTFIRGLYSRI